MDIWEGGKGSFGFGDGMCWFYGEKMEIQEESSQITLSITILSVRRRKIHKVFLDSIDREYISFRA